jgi:hypothetical protein
MRILRYLLAMALVAGLSGAAKADTFVPGDFAAVVIDPVPDPSEITLILNQSFPVSLAACHADQLDGLSTADFVGCFTGLNISGTPLTSLSMQFPAIFLTGHVLDLPNCPVEPQNIFSSITCGFTDPTDTAYILTFSGGNIPSFGHGPDCPTTGLPPECEQDSLFTIAIGGIPFSSLPQNFTVQANTITVTPEPSSLWLMSTGVLSVGLFAAFRRRQILCPSRP